MTYMPHGRPIRLLGVFLATLMVFILGGCRAGAPTATRPPIPLSTSPTPVPTATSTPIPTPTITTTPVPQTVIDFTPSPYQGPLPEGAKAILGMNVIDDWEVSPDGNYLAIVTHTDYVTLYSAATWEPIWSDYFDTWAPYIDFRWSPDGSKMSVRTDIGVFVWEVQTGKELFIIDLFDFYAQPSPYLENEWRSAEWSPDGKHLALSSIDETFVINTDTGAMELKFSIPGESVNSPMWSPDGTVLSTRVGEGMPYYTAVWDMANAEIVHTIDNAQIEAWYPDYQTMVVLKSDGYYEVRSTDTEQQALASSDSKPVISPDGMKVAVNDGNTTHILNTQTGALLQVLEHNNLSPESLSWSPDNTMLAVSGTKVGQVWNVNTGQLLFSMDLYYPPETQIWSSDSKLLIARSISGADMAVWDVETGKPVRALLGQEWIFPQFLPDSNVLVLVRSSNLLGLWNAQTGEMLHQIVGALASGPFDVTIAWSEDGRRIVLNASTTTDIWDTATGKLVTRASETANIWDIATSSFLEPFTSSQSKNFIPDDEKLNKDASPDGTRYVEYEESSTGTTIILQDSTTNQIVRRIPHCSGLSEKRCGYHRWSSDGQLLATYNYSSLRIYRADTGVLVSIKTSPWGLDAISFGPDNKQIAATFDGAVIVWETP